METSTILTIIGLGIILLSLLFLTVSDKAHTFVFYHKYYVRYEELIKNIPSSEIVGHWNTDRKKRHIEYYVFALDMGGEYYEVKWYPYSDELSVSEGGEIIFHDYEVFDRKKFVKALREKVGR